MILYDSRDRTEFKFDKFKKKKFLKLNIRSSNFELKSIFLAIEKTIIKYKFKIFLNFFLKYSNYN